MTIDSTKTAIAENIERTVAQVSFRKIRSLVDEVQHEEARQRVIQKRIVVTALTCLIAFLAVQTWQKTQQQKADRAREAVYACESKASREQTPKLRDELMLELPNLDPREFRMRLFERQVLLWSRIHRQCAAAGAN